MRHTSEPRTVAGLVPQGAAVRAARPTALMLPIRALGENHRTRIAAHLTALGSHDRYLRFGYPASDAQIGHYVDSIDFDRDELFGIYNRHLHLIAMAHVAYAVADAPQDSAEFGVSVLERARGRGYGARLFERAVINARNQGVRTMAIHMLSENAAMLHMARRAGAIVERDGAESQAYLCLPPATLNSRFSEWLRERMAQVNYRFKLNVKQLRERIRRRQCAGGSRAGGT